MDIWRNAKKASLGLIVLVALVLPASALGAPSSAIQGSLFDTTWAGGCTPICPSPCRGGGLICSQRQPVIACPLPRSFPPICPPGCCGIEDPLYEGDDATITVRRAGSERVMRTVAPHEGHFSIPLGPGRYALRGHVAQPCWSGEKEIVTVTRGMTTVAALDVHDDCLVHPDAAQ